MWGAPSDERRVCRLQLLLALTSAVIRRSESHEADNHILLSQIRDSPNLEAQVSVFISPRKREFLRNNIIRIQFVPQRKQITSSLERSAGSVQENSPCLV
jgi:hypothetical protein